MANLKVDFINKLNNRKYYDETELIRLAQEPNMNYEEKLELMDEILKKIAIINIQISLINQVYFKEPEVAPQAAPQAAPQGQVHQGQSHGE